jgi:branched-chain amino acid transport system permease protein
LSKVLSPNTVAASGGLLAATLYSRYRMVVWLVVASVCVVAVGPLVFGEYTVNVLTRAFLFAVLALTIDVLWGYTGILTFAQGAFFGIGLYAAGLTFTHVGFTTGTVVLALVGGVLAAVVLAGFVGWLAFWHGASTLYIAVVTLVFPICVVQVIYSGGQFTGSSSGLVNFAAPHLPMWGWFIVSGALLAIVTGIMWVVVKSDYGRTLNAIRDNELRCRYLGVPTSRQKIYLMMAMAGIAAAAGFIFACVGTFAAPEYAGFVFGTELVIYVALGGRGTIVGPVLGTVALEWVSAYLSGVLPFVWKLIIGAIFVVVIVALPQGLLPPVWHVLRRRLPAGFLSASAKEAAAVEVAGRATADGRPGLTDEPALALSGVRKHYGALSVLDGIDMTVEPSELVGIVGPNGAGKTTLMRCISDGMERSGGTVAINGHGLRRDSPADIVAYGLGRSFQTTSLFESLTVGECLRLARSYHLRPSKLEQADRIALPQASHRVLESTGLIERLDERVHNLPHGLKRALELAMVLALEPSVLLLDEPTAGLTKQDRQLVGSILTDLRRELGLAIVLIEHDLDFVKEICTRLVVLHRGQLVLDGPVDEVVNSEVVQEIYSGGHT